MNKGKWLIILIASLVLINIVLLAVIWLEKDTGTPPERGKDAREYLLESLSLSKKQIDSFDSLRKKHFEKIQYYQQQMRVAKDNLFGQLTQPEMNSADTLAQIIGAIQTKIDLETFSHFSQLRSLLNVEQKEKFDKVIQQVLRNMGPRGGPPPGDRRRPRPGLSSPSPEL